IELSESLRSHLQQENRQFLEPARNIQEEDALLIIQYPYSRQKGKQVLSISWGLVDTARGHVNLIPAWNRHTVSTESSSSGSPAILKNKKVFGIHRAWLVEEDRNVLTRIDCVIDKLNGNQKTHQLDQDPVEHVTQQVETTVSKPSSCTLFLVSL